MRAVWADDQGLFKLAASFFQFGVLGVAGSFAIHEGAHAATLTRMPGVQAAQVQVTLLRVSIQPTGAMTAAEMITFSMAGPVCTGFVGALIWACQPQSALAWTYLLHMAFMLPVFGDGQGLLTAIRLSGRSRQFGNATDPLPARLLTRWVSRTPSRIVRKPGCTRGRHTGSPQHELTSCQGVP
jgi:hypothetical protein